MTTSKPLRPVDGRLSEGHLASLVVERPTVVLGGRRAKHPAPAHVKPRDLQGALAIVAWVDLKHNAVAGLGTRQVRSRFSSDSKCKKLIFKSCRYSITSESYKH